MTTFTPPTKRTMGQCTCLSYWDVQREGHMDSCESLCPLQPQPGDETDALTRLAHLVRTRIGMSRDAFGHAAIALISEARDENRQQAATIRALADALADALEAARTAMHRGEFGDKGRDRDVPAQVEAALRLAGRIK